MAITNFDIDFSKMVKVFLGQRPRKTIRVAWLTAVLKPLRDIHDQLVSLVTAKRDEIKWNGQTIILEALLIDKFGTGIEIVNNVLELNGAFVGEAGDTSFFIGQGNDQSQHIDVTYTISGTNFTVNVPSAIVFEQTEMEAYINKYKMFGTTYEIVII